MNGGAVKKINPLSITGTARELGGGVIFSDTQAAPNFPTFYALISESDE